MYLMLSFVTPLTNSSKCRLSIIVAKGQFSRIDKHSRLIPSQQLVFIKEDIATVEPLLKDTLK